MFFFFYDLNQVVYAYKLNVLKLSEVCDVEVGVSMDSDLGLCVTLFKINAVGSKICLWSPSFEFLIPFLREVTVQSSNVVLLVVVEKLEVVSA